MNGGNGMNNEECDIKKVLKSEPLDLTNNSPYCDENCMHLSAWHKEYSYESPRYVCLKYSKTLIGTDLAIKCDSCRRDYNARR